MSVRTGVGSKRRLTETVDSDEDVASILMANAPPDKRQRGGDRVWPLIFKLIGVKQWKTQLSTQIATINSTDNGVNGEITKQVIDSETDVCIVQTTWDESNEF